jgi:hypothetical protein
MSNCDFRRGAGWAPIYIFDRALVIGQEIFGAEDTFEVEQLPRKLVWPPSPGRPDDKPPASIYADILRGGSSSSGNGQT